MVPDELSRTLQDAVLTCLRPEAHPARAAASPAVVHSHHRPLQPLLVAMHDLVRLMGGGDALAAREAASPTAVQQRRGAMAVLRQRDKGIGEQVERKKTPVTVQARSELGSEVSQYKWTSRRT